MSIDLTMGYKQIYDALRNDKDAELRRNQLLEGKVAIDAFDPALFTNAIGSFDATSCLGCVFTAKNGKEIVTFHHDGRDLKNLSHLFKAYKGEVVQLDITGGIQTKDKEGNLGNNYSLIEEECTLENFKTLINFSRFLPCKVELKSWTIGNDTPITGPVCEYLATPEKGITLLQTGAIHAKCLPPEFIARFTFNAMSPETGVSIVFDSVVWKGFALQNKPQVFQGLRNFATGIKAQKNDAVLLNKCSTTPQLEPPYFCDTLKKFADFVVSKSTITELNPPVPTKSPCIILQGEGGRLHTN